MAAEQYEDSANLERLLRSHRKKPLFSPDDLPTHCSFGPEIVMRLLPHRPPLLFVDRITGLDLAEGRISGSRTLPVDDPVFAGHFPGTPVYPGSFQIEMIGQLGLCLHHFHATGTVVPPREELTLSLRATRVLGAYYTAPLIPPAEVTLLGRMISFDGYFARLIGQCLAGGTVTCVCAGEVIFLDSASE